MARKMKEDDTIVDKEPEESQVGDATPAKRTRSPRKVKTEQLSQPEYAEYADFLDSRVSSARSDAGVPLAEFAELVGRAQKVRRLAGTS